MVDLYNKTNYLIYDPANALQSFIAKLLDTDTRLDKLKQKEVFVMSYKELLPDYAGLKDDDYKDRFVFIVDFDIDENFEAMDQSYKTNLSDKRVYYAKDALGKAFAYTKNYKNIGFLKMIFSAFAGKSREE
jgi:hypothetical protein